MNTFSEVEHIEVWGEVVSGIPSGQMVQVGLMKKLPAIPEETGGESHDLSISIQSNEKLVYSFKFLCVQSEQKQTTTFLSH